MFIRLLVSNCALTAASTVQPEHRGVMKLGEGGLIDVQQVLYSVASNLSEAVWGSHARGTGGFRREITAAGLDLAQKV